MTAETVIPIVDPRDPRLAIFRDIRERDIVGRGGFIAEGTVVEQLLGCRRFAATSLLILENRLPGLARLLYQVPPGIPVFSADRATFDAVAGFPVHRGVLAHGEALPRPPAEEDALLRDLAAANGRIVVSVGIGNHDNMGAIFRNAAAFGVGLVLVDETSCDPLYRKAIRVSAGHVLTVPFERAGCAAAILARLGDAGFRCLALSPEGTIRIESLSASAPTALFLGAEGPGLPASLMAGMETLRIAMAPGFDSLNVATAAAIALHRLYPVGGPRS